MRKCKDLHLRYTDVEVHITSVGLSMPVDGEPSVAICWAMIGTNDLGQRKQLDSDTVVVDGDELAGISNCPLRDLRGAAIMLSSSVYQTIRAAAWQALEDVGAFLPIAERPQSIDPIESTEPIASPKSAIRNPK